MTIGAVTNAHPGAALLAALDSAMPLDRVWLSTSGARANRQSVGLQAATALSTLLGLNRLGWSDVIEPGSRLAKLCGRLGSDFAGEREAAYAHALHFILASRTTWSAVIHLPATLEVRPTRAPAILSAPEEDWLTTVRRLRARSAWRSLAERQLLDAVEARLIEGGKISAAEIATLRDIWWQAELNTPGFTERPK